LRAVGPRAADRVRRLAPGHDLPRPLRTCPRLPARAWLRTPRGRQGDRRGRPAPPHHHELRGRGRRDHAGRPRGPHLRGCGRSVKSAPGIVSRFASLLRPRGRAVGAARDEGGANGVASRPKPDRETRSSEAVPREVLRQVRLIELRTRGWVEAVFSGEYQSVFRGQGMEFAEVREDQAGDDVRNIDWNVTARMAHPFVKKHIEERALTVLAAVDLSGSGQFGTRGRFKAELAAEIAAVLSLSAVRNNDRVGLLLFTDRVEHYVPPKKGRRHVLRLIRDLLVYRPTGTGTDLGAALEYMGRILPHRAIIFLLSDFMVPPPPDVAGLVTAPSDGLDVTAPGWVRALRVLSRRHDVVAITITDAAELRLPDAG